jgi:hypothetical protein
MPRIILIEAGMKIDRNDEPPQRAIRLKLERPSYECDLSGSEDFDSSMSKSQPCQKSIYRQLFQSEQSVGLMNAQLFLGCYDPSRRCLIPE